MLLKAAPWWHQEGCGPAGTGRAGNAWLNQRLLQLSLLPSSAPHPPTPVQASPRHSTARGGWCSRHPAPSRCGSTSRCWRMQ